MKILAGLALAAAICAAAETRFEVTVPPAAHPGPITGRVYVMISHRNEPDLQLQVGRLGIPFFGRDVENLSAGSPAMIDATDLGSPVVSLADLPPGEYWVQGFVNLYSEFHRADGHVLWMHDDQWEGQRWNRSPGLRDEIRLCRRHAYGDAHPRTKKRQELRRSHAARQCY